ncbi:hypothetical protein, partial [Burkholderia pseudomallei]|uniref:hypothetical protein n=1 Tax=Burkholderia pseudomallei TaxID=28450 RepID=UPI001F22BBB7
RGATVSARAPCAAGTSRRDIAPARDQLTRRLSRQARRPNIGAPSRLARNGVAPPCRGIEPLQPHGRLIPSAKTYILCACLIDGPLRRRIERFSPHPPS